MITLYSIPPSLYSAKTRIVLRAKKLEWRDVEPPGGYGSAEYREIVPAGTLPAIDHDGFVLTESEAINEYLNEVFPDPPMLPDEPRPRAQARALSRFHDTRLEPAVRALFPLVAPAPRNNEVIARQADLISKRLTQLAKISDPAPLLCGDRLSLADCGYPITFIFLETLPELMGFAVDWPAKVRSFAQALRNEPTIAAELRSYEPAVKAWARTAASGHET